MVKNPKLCIDKTVKLLETAQQMVSVSLLRFYVQLLLLLVLSVIEKQEKVTNLQNEFAKQLKMRQYFPESNGFRHVEEVLKMQCSVKQPYTSYKKGFEKVRSTQVSSVKLVDEYVTDTPLYFTIRFQMVPCTHVSKIRITEEIHFNVVLVGYQQSGIHYVSFPNYHQLNSKTLGDLFESRNQTIP